MLCNFDKTFRRKSMTANITPEVYSILTNDVNNEESKCTITLLDSQNKILENNEIKEEFHMKI